MRQNNIGLNFLAFDKEANLFKSNTVTRSPTGLITESPSDVKAKFPFL
jgi:hypothetical protein